MLGFPTQGPARKSTRTVGPRLQQLEDRTNPVLFGIGDAYTATAGQVLTIPASQGVLANDFSDQFPGSPITVINQNAAGQIINGVIGQPRYTGSTQPLPANSAFLNQDGSFTFIAPPASQIPANVTQVTFTYTASNLAGETSAPTTVTINLQIGNVRLIATGADAGGGPHVKAFESGTGLQRFSFFPFESTFTGGVRVAVGDIDNDGFDDIVCVPATGGAVRVRAYSGRDGAPLLDQFAFDPNFRGGGYVAVGDYNGDGIKDIIVGAGEGGGPRVQVIALNPASPTGASVIGDFFAFDSAMTSGVRVAAGDLQGTRTTLGANTAGGINQAATGTGRDFIVTAPGAGGGPQVNVFDPFQIRTRPVPFPVLSFFAADSTNRDGVFVSTGVFSSSGQADIVTGTGSDSAVVRVFNGRTGALTRELTIPVDQLPTGGGTPGGPSTFPIVTPPSGALLSPTVRPNALLPTSVGSPVPGAATGGARVATTDYNKDGIDDIVVAAGPGNAPRVQIFSGTNQTLLFSLLAYDPSFLGGVNVGAD